MEMKWEFESSLALRAVSLGCDRILDGAPLVEVKSKEANRSLVTDVDQDVEWSIIEMLRPAQHPILAEESYAKDGAMPVTGKPYWMVDPLDGTVNYVHGIPYYAVSVGLGVDQTFLVGAVAVPPTKEMFFTQGTQNAYLNGKALKLREDRSLASGLVVGGFPNQEKDEKRRTAQYEAFGWVNESSRGCLRMGSAATNVCYVAAGRFQAAFGVKNYLWDVAAGFAIAKAAGCRIYLERTENSPMINYIVGAPKAAGELAEGLVKKGLFAAGLKEL